MTKFPPLMIRYFIKDNSIMTEVVQVKSKEQYETILSDNKKLGDGLTFDFSFLTSPEFRKRDEEYRRKYSERLEQ